MKNKLKALVLVVFGLAVVSCGKKQEAAPAAPPGAGQACAGPAPPGNETARGRSDVRPLPARTPGWAHLAHSWAMVFALVALGTGAISTRRFCARPFSSALSATGCSAPKAAANTCEDGIPS